MGQKFAQHWQLKQLQPHALIEHAVMPPQLMEPQQLTLQHLLAKPIYRHAIGMEIQDVQTEDVILILVYNQLVQLSQQLEYLAGHYQ